MITVTFAVECAASAIAAILSSTQSRMIRPRAVSCENQWGTVSVDMSRAADEIVTTRGAECDVLIIGGGPAGTTAAAILAERGRDVVLLEKDRHPRFHIGESLLPGNLPLFERLGIAEDVRRIGIY